MNNKSFQSNVIAGILSGLLLILFVQPFLTWVWNIFLSGSIFTFTYVNNAIYRNAAYGQRDWVVAVLTLILLGFFVLHILGKVGQKMTPQSMREKVDKIFSGKLVKNRMIIILSGILTTFLCIILMASVFADIQLNTSFKQRLNALLPYISEQEEEELRSMWAMMGNRQDYVDITNKMDSIAAEKGIRIPDLLLK